jgi:hypothetical protein
MREDIICHAANLNHVIEAVGEKNAILRGNDLIERLMDHIHARTEM